MMQHCEDEGRRLSPCSARALWHNHLAFYSMHQSYYIHCYIQQMLHSSSSSLCTWPGVSDVTRSKKKKRKAQYWKSWIAYRSGQSNTPWHFSDFGQTLPLAFGVSSIRHGSSGWSLQGNYFLASASKSSL